MVDLIFLQDDSRVDDALQDCNTNPGVFSYVSRTDDLTNLHQAADGMDDDVLHNFMNGIIENMLLLLQDT